MNLLGDCPRCCRARSCSQWPERRCSITYSPSYWPPTSVWVLTWHHPRNSRQTAVCTQGATCCNTAQHAAMAQHAASRLDAPVTVQVNGSTAILSNFKTPGLQASTQSFSYCYSGLRGLTLRLQRCNLQTTSSTSACLQTDCPS